MLNSNTGISTIEHHPEGTYYLYDSAEKMPSKCWGDYRRLAIILVAPGGTPPKIITDTKTARVIYTWDKLHSGSRGMNTAYDRAFRQCDDLLQLIDHGKAPAEALEITHQKRLWREYYEKR